MNRCSDCGFLALRKDTEFGQLIEALRHFRETGDAANVRDLHPVPRCFVMKWDLQKDVEQTTADITGRANKVKEVIERERDCTDVFVQWRQGFTPKEHAEIRDKKLLLDSQNRREDEDRKWRAQMAEDDRQWREGQEEKAESRHKDQMATMRGIHKREMWIMGVAVTIALLIVAVIGAAIQASWIPKWFGVFP